MAKAAIPNLRKAENWAELGRVVKRTWLLSGLSLKEFAAAIDRNERQVARWCIAAERPQIETIYAVVPLRGSLVVAMAETSGNVEVETVVRVKRIA